MLSWTVPYIRPRDLKVEASGDRFYSHVSATHRSGSHIDLMFGTASVFSCVCAASYLLAGLSDHSPTEILPSLGTGHESGCWRLAPDGCAPH